MSVGGDPVLRIIGIGSPFGADALGWEAIHYLEHQDTAALFPGFRIELETCAIPAALPERMSGAHRLVLLDAVLDPSRPAEVLRLTLEDLDTLSAVSSSHGFGVAEALHLVDALGQWPAWWRLYGLVSPSAELTAAEREALFEAWIGLLQRDLGSTRRDSRRSA